MLLNNTGNNNTAVGWNAMLVNSSGSQNTAVGQNSMFNATGSLNTAIGQSAMYSNTSGSNNTALGQNSMLTTNFTNCTTLGYNTTVTGNNQVQLGDSTTTTYVYGTVQNRSDARDKADIRDTVLGLEFIKQLRPVDYRWNLREDYIQIQWKIDTIECDTDTETEFDVCADSLKIGTFDPLTETIVLTDDHLFDSMDVTFTPLDIAFTPRWSPVEIIQENNGSRKRNRYHHGFIAQDLQNLNFGGYQDHSIKGGKDVLSLGYDELIAPLVKAVQELEARLALVESPP